MIDLRERGNKYIWGDVRVNWLLLKKIEEVNLKSCHRNSLWNGWWVKVAKYVGYDMFAIKCKYSIFKICGKIKLSVVTIKNN